MDTYNNKCTIILYDNVFPLMHFVLIEYSKTHFRFTHAVIEFTPVVCYISIYLLPGYLLSEFGFGDMYMFFSVFTRVEISIFIIVLNYKDLKNTV